MINYILTPLRRKEGKSTLHWVQCVECQDLHKLPHILSHLIFYWTLWYKNNYSLFSRWRCRGSGRLQNTFNVTSPINFQVKTWSLLCRPLMLSYDAGSLLPFSRTNIPCPQSIVINHTVPHPLPNYNQVGEITSHTVNWENNQRGSKPPVRQRRTALLIQRENLLALFTDSKCRPNACVMCR